MNDSPAKPMTPEPFEGALKGADDRLLLNHWLPPQAGIVPRSPLNSASSVQQTQKSFSTFCGVVPMRWAVVMNSPWRVAASARRMSS